MSTPRPSGAQASSPAPWCAAAGSSSASRVAGEQGVLGLHRGRQRRGHRARARSAAVASCQPAGPDEPDVAHATRTPPPHRRRERLVQRDVADPSRAAATGRGVGTPAGAAPGRARRAAPPRPAPPPCGPSASRLRPAMHEVVARHGAPQQAGEHVLRDAAAVAVGGLHQRPARACTNTRSCSARRIAVGVVAPGHGAQADPRHLQPAAAHPSSLHVGQPKGGRYWAARRARLSEITPEGRYGAAP